jgi:hypothetical protein
MTNRFDPSLIALLAGGGTPTTDASKTDGTNLLDEAVTLVVDFIAGGDNRSGRICVEHGNDRTWLLLDQYTPSDSDTLHFTSRTNDLDLMCGTPPSFHVADPDPGVVHEQSVAFFNEKFAGKDVRILVFRQEGSRSEPNLEATTATGAFREQPEFPSL